jgi:hypothetical protein
VLRPLTTRVPAFGLLAERESDSNFEALRLQKRLRFLTEVPIRIRQVRHINGSLLFRVSRLVLGSVRPAKAGMNSGWESHRGKSPSPVA